MSRAEQTTHELRTAFDAGITRSRRWRRDQLRALRRMLLENQPEIEQALHDDLGKHPLEAVITEIGMVIAEIDYALPRLRRWMRARTVPLPLMLAPARGRVVPEPLGVVLIIGPWNYPLQLVLNPLVGALAAGNAAVVKPSELAGATSSLLAELLPLYLDQRALAVVEGGAEVTGQLLEQRFDHIFFTGSEKVGGIVATAAAGTLTP
ncbi:MAG: aldehyde dehydrogenase family protein, partial [Actinomycetota bacterium]|nr:aldehyde dehydrogenase family protein [Actinomycetota bacterium]